MAACACWSQLRSGAGGRSRCHRDQYDRRSCLRSIAAAGSRHGGCRIEADQDEAGKVPIDPVMMPPAIFIPSERTSKQAGSFRPCKMTLPWLRLQW